MKFEIEMEIIFVKYYMEAIIASQPFVNLCKREFFYFAFHKYMYILGLNDLNIVYGACRDGDNWNSLFHDIFGSKVRTSARSFLPPRKTSWFFRVAFARVPPSPLRLVFP